MPRRPSTTSTSPVATLRVLRGMSQEELAGKVGVTRVHITRMEGGQVDTLKRPEVRRMAAALGVPAPLLAALLFLDDDTSKSTETSAPAD